MSTTLATRFSEFCIRHRVVVTVIIALATLAMASTLTRIDVRTVFSDMVPHNHPYVQVHERYRDTFAGSNKVTILLKVNEGEIFRLPVLEEVQRITNGLTLISGVNSTQIVSIASRKLKRVTASSEGIETLPLMWPDLPNSQEEVQALRQAVLNNPLVYGIYVDNSLSSTQIQVDFYDQLVDYSKIFPQIQALLDDSPIADQISLHMVGEPILYGWVNHHLGETFSISMISLIAMLAFLFLMNRTWRGTLLPLISGLVSCIWALGVGVMLGFNFDPLVIVVAFIITARCFSHAVQMIVRFDDLGNAGFEPKVAAEMTMRELFRPGLLGIVSDAGAILCVIATPIPLLQKVAILATIWVMTICISAVVLTPVLLSWVRAPLRFAHPVKVDGVLTSVLKLTEKVVTTRARFVILPLAAALTATCAWKALDLTIGDASHGSPILWEDSEFNRDSALINELYPGSEQMFVVVEAQQDDGLKSPEILQWMQDFSRYMERMPEIGGSVSLADIVVDVRRNLFEGNPRYRELGATLEENGEMISFYAQGIDPDDLAQFTDAQFRNGAVTLYFRDHKGDTLRNATYHANQFIANNPLEGADVRLAGGVLGIIAAVNEILLADQIEAICLALLVVVMCCVLVYRSSASGIFFIVPVLISNVVTFAFMAINDIGMSISTIPVVALGIGLGVDYAFYIIDSIKEYLEKNPMASPEEAVVQALYSAGRGVLLTSVTLAAGVLFWSFSSLRFQAEMGMLIGLWLITSAFTSLFVMPSLALVLKPAFVFGHGQANSAPAVSERSNQPKSIGN